MFRLEPFDCNVISDATRVLGTRCGAARGFSWKEGHGVVDRRVVLISVRRSALCIRAFSVTRVRRRCGIQVGKDEGRKGEIPGRSHSQRAHIPRAIQRKPMTRVPEELKFRALLMHPTASPTHGFPRFIRGTDHFARLAIFAPIGKRNREKGTRTVVLTFLSAFH